MAVADGDVQIRELTADEGREALDRAARRYLGMTADEFLQAWDEGKFEGNDSLAVARVSMLIGLAR